MILVDSNIPMYLVGAAHPNKEAARRALKRLGARQVKTQKAPVVFSPEIARGIIGNIFSAAEGDARYDRTR